MYTHNSCMANYTHLCPNSWAMVKAVLSPLSLLMLQLLVGSHALPTSAMPATNHIEDKYARLHVWCIYLSIYGMYAITYVVRMHVCSIYSTWLCT